MLVMSPDIGDKGRMYFETVILNPDTPARWSVPVLAILGRTLANLLSGASRRRSRPREQ